jgi:hypothetical protein
MSLPSNAAAGSEAKTAASASRPEHTPLPRFAGLRAGASQLWPLALAALVKLLIASACVLSAWQLGTYLKIARGRLFYPYALEWMEGGVLEHVARVLEGKPLYVAPSLEFTPFIYTPLYYWVCAPVAHVMGVQLPSLRLVSCLASLLIFVLLFCIVFARTRNAIAGFIAMGCYAACFEVCSGWFDLARVDSLSLCFLLLATWLLVRGDRHDAWAGTCLALAVLTKQSALVAALPLIAARVLTQTGWRRLHAGLAFSSIVLGVSLLQNWLSHGYYAYYVFALPAQHDWLRIMRREFWRSDIFANVPFACAAALYVLTTPTDWRSHVTLWSAALGYCAVGWISRMHVGGASNVLMPTMAFLAWTTGEALHRLAQGAAEDATRHSAESPTLGLWERSLRHSNSLFGLALCVGQLSWLMYAPASHIPDAKNRRSGAALIAYLRTVKGPILSPFDPLLPRLVAGTGSVHQQALTDISLGKKPRKQAAVTARIRAQLAQRRYAMVVGGWETADLETAGYVRVPLAHALPSSWTLEGAPLRMTELWMKAARPPAKP